MTSEQIHHYTNTKPVNIFVHEQAIKTWKTLEQMEHDTYLKLKEKQDNILHYHKNFPSSLQKITQQITPIYK